MSTNANLPGSQPIKPKEEHARDFDANGEPLHSLEPPAEGGEADPAPTPAAAEPADAAEAKPKPKPFKDDVRAAIAAKRDAMTVEERNTFAKEQPAEAAIADQIAGYQEEEEEPEPAAPAAPAAAPAAPAAPLASSGKKYRLTVYGKDAGEADEETVIQAGIAALQKQHAADERMGQVATREAQLLQYQKDLQAFADNLARGLDQDGRPLTPAGGPGNPQPPDTGVAGAIDAAKVKQAFSAALRGDDEEGSRLMAEAVGEALARGRAAPAPAPRTVEVPRLPAAPAPPDPWGEPQRQAANELFNQEYADLTDAQFDLVKVKLDRLIQDPANHHRNLNDLVREAGNTVRRATGAAPPPSPTPAAPSPTPAASTLETRRTFKARIPVTPPPASGRAPSSQAPAPRFPTAKDHVRRLQERNGSNSSPRPQR